LGLHEGWRFGADCCRPSAHCSHLLLTNSGRLGSKFSPAIPANKMEVKNSKFNSDIQFGPLSLKLRFTFDDMSFD
jgi:hypothetical protein